MSDLTEINETLKKIEKKIEDKSPSQDYYFTSFLDYEKIQEKSRKEREEKRNEEIFEMQKAQSEDSKIQTASIKNQEKFTGIVAFTGGIIALATIYGLILKIVPLENYPLSYWILNSVFLILIVLCIGPLTKFIINFWKKEVLGR